MLRVKKILCPTDFSKLSDRALVYAADLSARFGAKLYIQHVMEGVFDSMSDLYMAPEAIQAIWASYDHNLDEQLSQRLGSVSPYIKVLSHGSPAQDILQTANEQEIDLIVMGIKGGLAP